MAWNVNENIKRREDLQGPHNQAPRSAYVAGYGDGWYNLKKWASNMPDFHPGVYCDGFIAGRQDGQGESNLREFVNDAK